MESLQNKYHFLEILQKEYLIAELRHKIYPLQKDKKYWQKVMDGKKQKIESVSALAKAPNIFNDTYLREVMGAEVTPDSGYPKFIYANAEALVELELKDFIYYFTIGCRFIVETEEEQFEAVLRHVHREKGIATMQVEGEQKLQTYPVAQLTRIF